MPGYEVILINSLILALDSFNLLLKDPTKSLKMAIPFANIGRWTSRTFPRIGKTLESTPFSRGMNCIASMN